VSDCRTCDSTWMSKPLNTLDYFFRVQGSLTQNCDQFDSDFTDVILDRGKPLKHNEYFAALDRRTHHVQIRATFNLFSESERCG
jgi:hypothetical protein